MKYNPYENEEIGNRRTGRPPLPADSKYRLEQQHGYIPEGLDDDEDAYHPITPPPKKKNL